MPRFFLIAAISYLLGSIPFGYLLVRIFRGEDVRRSGSGNIGATNVSRKSPALGAMTLILDAAKGFFAVQLAVLLSRSSPYDPRLYRVTAASALLAIVGHMFPIWLRFRGGKGVASALGAFLRINPAAVIFAIIMFILVVLIFRRISLASIVAAALFPVADRFSSTSPDPWVTGLTATASLFIIGRHHQNIRRLISGEEPRFSLRRNKVSPK